jgi:hypothetical protein
MRLVEVISGLATAPEVADAAAGLAAEWGKTVVRSTATPGFIVNRIARPFYAEAWRLHEEHASVPQHIDAVLTGGGGFRMGPFALMDLIGHDVNEAVTRSVWSAFGYDPRFAPSLAQRALVEAGWLGRKAGRGVYPEEGAPAPAPAAAAPPPPAVTEHRGLDSLDDWYRDGRYRPSPLLRRTALAHRSPTAGTYPVSAHPAAGGDPEEARGASSRCATRAPSAGSASTAPTSATPSTRRRATRSPPPWTTPARGPAC